MAIAEVLLCAAVLASGLAHAAAKGYGQDLVDRTLKRHPELIGLDIHATPPGSARSLIIASNNAARIGSHTDPDDLEVFTTGRPRVEINRAGDENVEVAAQLRDVTGRAVGTIEMTFPYQAGTDEEDLLEKANRIEGELRQRISGERGQAAAELVAPAQVDPSIPLDTYGQFLVDDTLAKLPGVAIIALHVKSPSGADYPLLASNIGRIGKPADESDRKVIETGEPVLAVSKDSDRLEAKVPLRDVTGETVGAVAIVFPYGGHLNRPTHRQLSFERSLLAQAESIRDQLRRRIADGANLYEPYPYEPGVQLYEAYPYQPGVALTVSAATYAEAVVKKILEKHPEVLILALRVTTPKGVGYPIIASNVGRIGKREDADDLKVIETGNPKVAPARGRIEVEVRLRDKSGNAIGAMVAVYRYPAGDDQSPFVTQAVALETEVRQMIPSPAHLIERVRPEQSEYDVPELGNTQELPMTKAVVSGQALEQGAQEGYSEAVKNVAGVAPANSKGSPNDSIYIRGIKLNLFSNYRLNGGLPTAGVITTPTENKERIEALKGANALMFGVASPAGIINLVTKRAGDVDVNSVSVGANAFGQIGGSVDVGRRLGGEKELGVRINGSAVYLENGVHNMYGDGEFISAGLDYKASERLVLQGDFEYYRKHVPEQAGVSLLPAANGVVPLTPVPEPRNLLSGRWGIYTPDTKNAQIRADYALTDDLKLVTEGGGSWASRSRYSVRIGNYDLATGAGGAVSVNFVSQRYQNLFGRAELLGRVSTAFLHHQFTLGVAIADRESATPTQNNTTLTQRQNIFDPIELDPARFHPTAEQAAAADQQRLGHLRLRHHFDRPQAEASGRRALHHRPREQRL